MVTHDFNQLNALAAKALRILNRQFGRFRPVHMLSLQYWLKRLALHYRRYRSSILMISSGIDYFAAGFDPVDPDLDSTIERAQKKR